jgi:hypothetical protein
MAPRRCMGQAGVRPETLPVKIRFCKEISDGVSGETSTGEGAAALAAASALSNPGTRLTLRLERTRTVKRFELVSFDHPGLGDTSSTYPHEKYATEAW